MALPVSFVSLTMADNTVKSNGTPETTTMSVPITTLNAGNYAAQSALIADLITALEGVTIGNPIKSETVILRDIISSDAASDTLAQRENKWLIRYHGNTLNQKFQVSIGTADLSQLVDHTEFMDLTTGAGSALKSAFEAIVKSPDDASEGVTLDSVQFVGRNT